MKTLNIALEDFLRAFFEPNDTICLRVFDDRKQGTFKGAKLEAQAGKIASITDNLNKHNAQNRGIYFVVNSGGHEDSDITRVNAQFVECDSLSFDEQEKQLADFSLPPSLIVKTKKSLHAYWLMKSAEVGAFRKVQKQLISHFHGDPVCVNESRVMRLPGFNHCKSEPVPVECVKFNPELRYSQSELSAALPGLPDEPIQPAVSVKGTCKGLTLVKNRCDFIRHCTENAAVLSEHDWYAMISNLAVFEDGGRLIHELSRQYPNYKSAETQEKISHFLESGTKPITCCTISEKGFVCPKLGICSCKAPAALCYVPMNTAELTAAVNEIGTSDDTLANVESALGFISEYLYNIEPGIAEAFISYTVKEHFKLKSADLKPLIASYKDAYRRYSQSKEAKRHSEDRDLPEWYELSDKGGYRFIPGILAKHMSQEVSAFYAAEQYYVYDSGVYVAQNDLYAKNMVRQNMIPRYTTLGHINDAEGQWRMQIMRSLREINANPYVINVRNGLYNVLDDSFKPHTPEYLSTVQLNVNYTPGADCPRFRQFLGESLGEAEIPLIQEMLGYFLIPVNKAQKSFVIVGEAGAGKSKLLLTLNEILLGQANVSNIPWQSLNERFKTAELFGKLANIFADLPTRNIDDNGIFKALVGEDFLTVERKNKDPFSFQPFARLLFSCNSIPRNYGDKSEGFYRRLIIIRFSKTVPPEKKDAELLTKFKLEANGIFMFAVEGLKRLIDNQYRFSETDATRAELQRYRVESNSVLSFVDECCAVDVNAEISREELFTRYQEYCKSGGMVPLSQRNFNNDIETMFNSVKRGTDKIAKRRTWKGIHLASD